MNWIELKDILDLEEANKSSFEKPIVIFKHSTRCSTSALVRNRLERNWKDEQIDGIKTYFLDLIRHRDISNAIESNYGIYHESPQLIILENGKATYNASHFSISFDDLLERIAA